MTPKEFIDKNYFSLTLDCKREINEIYQALEDYAEAKQLTIPVVSNCTILDELFYKCAESEPNLSREEFNEVLKLWLYRWDKDKQVKQIMKEL